MRWVRGRVGELGVRRGGSGGCQVGWVRWVSGGVGEVGVWQGG